MGKSSLINMLTGVKGLAKTSSTPGKTRLINNFLVDDRWHIVDLPGYGFAKISKSIREQLTKIIHGYILKREQLACTFILLDSRLAPQTIDMEFIHWMAKNGKPFVLLFTKVDKISDTNVKKNIALWKGFLEADFEELPLLILTSAKTRAGRQEVLEIIRQLETGNRQLETGNF